jgi:hypothetical protein
MCGWIYNPDMGLELKLEKCHVLIWEWADKRFVLAQCDPDWPYAWRAPIVMNFLRRTVREVPPDWKVIVMSGEKTWRITDRAILSDEGGVDWFVGCRATELWKFSFMPER